MTMPDFIFLASLNDDGGENRMGAKGALIAKIMKSLV